MPIATNELWREHLNSVEPLKVREVESVDPRYAVAQHRGDKLDVEDCTPRYRMPAQQGYPTIDDVNGCRKKHDPRHCQDHLRHREILTHCCRVTYAHAIWAWHQARQLEAG